MPKSATDLFERHHLAIFRYFLRLTGSQADAEDLTQDVFLRVVKTLDAYEERNSERAWLFRIARNLFSDRRRQAQRKPPPLGLEGVDATAPERQDLRLSLHSALQQLPEDERDAFMLVEIAGLSYAEIASLYSVTIAAVRSRVYRARIALRLSLEDPASKELLIRGTHEG